MTYHIKEKHVDDEPEEMPEDGLDDNGSENLGEIKETMIEEEKPDNKDGDNQLWKSEIKDKKNEDNCDDIKHVLNNNDETDSNKVVKTESKTELTINNFEAGK